jgi:hypothetical protein
MIYRNATQGVLEAVRLLCMRNTESSAMSRMACTAAGMIVRDDRNLIAKRSAALQDSNFHPLEANKGRDLTRRLSGKCIKLHE